jgi:hypothetical protein
MTNDGTPNLDRDVLQDLSAALEANLQGTAPSQESIEIAATRMQVTKELGRRLAFYEEQELPKALQQFRLTTFPDVHIRFDSISDVTPDWLGLPSSREPLLIDASNINIANRFQDIENVIAHIEYYRQLLEQVVQSCLLEPEEDDDARITASAKTTIASPLRIQLLQMKIEEVEIHRRHFENVLRTYNKSIPRDYDAAVVYNHNKREQLFRLTDYYRSPIKVPEFRDYGLFTQSRFFGNNTEELHRHEGYRYDIKGIAWNGETGSANGIRGRAISFTSCSYESITGKPCPLGFKLPTLDAEKELEQERSSLEQQLKLLDELEQHAIAGTPHPESKLHKDIQTVQASLAFCEAELAKLRSQLEQAQNPTVAS